MKNLGSEYLDHYEKYLGSPVDRYLMDAEDIPRKVQLLKYDNVFEDCSTFTTLGLSSYSNEFEGEFFELIVVTDTDSRLNKSIPKLIYSIIITVVLQGVKIRWGAYFT